ncbi:hypothetical protein QBC33DRAFT_460346 [Phialemonium atrogriseum]|uniref:Uncharacterized protein n=1 Tax=Phialemonium atrogriseum TaxID=1093897 RepID=A0AAJ0BVR1_9PEZI|nr:uncharacterized protein QBC33DRAFT_460346 [Phialemonium atrogriseum]KAK1762966.1 hypothetical protein QBC33DRAFT_460346 [Phialemonium atrogriseum]
MPPLSAAAARGANRTPLTPKIATTRSSTPQHHTVTVTTPLPRRVHRAESALGSGPATVKDEVASPVAAFLNGNVTPRSGSRQSRIDSANSTPTGTPNLDKLDSWETRSGLGLAPSALEADGPRQRPMVTFSPALDSSSATKQDPDSKFFYASQAPKLQTQQQQQPAIQPRPSITQPQKSSTFFYANGGAVPERQNAPPTNLTPVLGASPAPDSHRTSKFFYANGTPDLPPVARPAFSSNAGSTVSTSSKLPAPRLGAAASSAGYGLQRPPSPVKLPSFLPPKNDTISLSTARSAMGAAPPLAPATATLHRASTEPPASSSSGHSRSKSLTVADPPTIARIISTHSSHPPSEASSPSVLSSPGINITTATPAAAGFSSLLQAADDLADDEDDDDTKSEVLHSPTKASSSQEQALNDLVASARRERKVQDLEITNASLEAINRTLERQLRKQTAELRRYRRLSRSGRLSLSSVPGGRDRIASDSTAGGGALARAGLDLDDLTEESSEEDAGFDEEGDGFDSDSETESGSGEHSPGSVALRDARHRKRDEERLQLDLSKHQQLLVDSQKINQSLKRCLGWTEELIKEGRRALEYKVRVSEVQLGGRVLAPEDVEERESAVVYGDGDGEETLHGIVPELDDSPVAADDEKWPKDTQDRDSGIELPTDGG